jgi:uncharacterized YccA/Bax inhibitor family protein
MIRSTNPVMGEQIFNKARQNVAFNTERMTLDGTVNKTAILLGLALITAMWSWNVVFPGSANVAVGALPSPPGWLLMGAPFAAIIAALVTVFKPTVAHVSAPVYALLEGLVLGTISAMFEVSFPGIAMQAAFGTLATLGGLLLAYRSGVIQVTDKFRLGVVAATSGIFMLYFASFIMSFFGAEIPFIRGGGIMGIGFSLVVVVIAALNLVLSFDSVERGVEGGAPKHMEWYGAFGVMVTLVWLYIEMLILLSKLRGRD